MSSLVQTALAGGFALALASLGVAGAPAQAQTTSTTPVEREIARDATDLRDVVRPVPVDRDRVDSVLVFHNSARATGAVHCVAWDANGRPVGRFRVKVPGRGLRYVLASDASDGRDFVGSVQCSSPHLVIGSAFLLAPGLTALPAVQTEADGLVRLRFPAVATY